MVIVAKGEFHLQQVINITERWSARNGIEVNKAKSGIMVVRKDRRTPNPIQRSYRGYPLVDQYKYLGVLIDNCLNLQMEVQKKKQIERQLVTQQRRMAYMKLDQPSRYHVWQALFKSRTWYSIVLTSRLADKLQSWAKGYLYRSIKALMGVTGNPSTDRVYQSTFLESQDDTLNLIWSQAIVTKMLKTPIPQRGLLAQRYNLSDQIPTTDEELKALLDRPRLMWQRAKLALTRSSNQVFKWWVSTRY